MRRPHRAHQSRQSWLSGAVLLVGLVMFLSGETVWAQGPDAATKRSVGDPTEVRDQAKIKVFKDKFETLFKEHQETGKRLEGEWEACRRLESHRRTVSGPLLEKLEAELEDQREAAARTSLDHMDQYSELCNLADRLAALKELVHLRSEIRRLEGLRREKLTEIQRLEGQLEATSSKLINAKAMSRLTQENLDNARDPEKGRRKVDGEERVRLEDEFERHLMADGTSREAMKRVFRNNPRRPGALLRFEKDVKRALASAERWKNESHALQVEVKQLWDRLGSLKDEIVDLDVSLMMARISLDYLERTRVEWDRERQRSRKHGREQSRSFNALL